MTLEVRRVVTGHDKNGKARVIIDELSDNVISRRAGQQSTVIWATDQTPPNLEGLNDLSPDVKSTTVANGTVFRVSRFEPGVAPRNHRTASMDYAVVLSGQIDMELDDGEVVTLRAGDVLVQRGTVHNWTNPGTEPCIIAFVLMACPLPEQLSAEG
ncbi:MAG: cupin [Rhodospirillaceae bacterium]|nr:cupin [Rhodospirillaceae bacterium]|tara:strand:- start:743 stop:1210 length:468 start_codon:yes stop_codon:yes gene_type:complete